MQQPAFSVSDPKIRSTAVVFASPHSGSDYPEWFLKQSVLDSLRIRSSEDAFVDRLFADAPAFGAPLLAARMPRAIVDLNRDEHELDPALIEGVRRSDLNPRIASGLGVIPRVVANGRAIYCGKLPYPVAQKRIDAFWRPYHDQLAQMLRHTKTQFGQAILIDCHSMPHEAMDGVSRFGRARPQIVLGDRFGASAAPAIVDRVEAAFSAAGFEVARNTPFAGAFITQRYGLPRRDQHAVQVEIDRALYMDESRITPLPEFSAVKERLRGVIAEIATIGATDQRLAAE